jgi:MFS family permease
VIFASVVWPLYGLASVAYLIAGKQQWRWILLIIGAIVLLPLLTDFLIWGSFPLPIDQQGFIHADDPLHSLAAVTLEKYERERVERCPPFF